MKAGHRFTEPQITLQVRSNRGPDGDLMKNSPSVKGVSGAKALRVAACSKKPSLRIRAGKSPGHELHRIASEQMLWAIRELKRGKLSRESVHDVRTTLKKVRALLELSSPSQLKRERMLRVLKKAAGFLSPLRDAEVALESLDQIAKRHKVPKSEVTAARDRLKQGLMLSMQKTRPRLPLVVEALEEGAQLLGSLRHSGIDSKDLRQTVLHTYRRGRKVLRKSRKSDDAELFHSWRKVVKRLWYEVRITEGFWGADGKPLIKRLGELGEIAGTERDYTLLLGILPKEKTLRTAALIEHLLPRLRRKAERLGHTLYKERPRDFIAGMGT